jgi:hypothetical protein
MTPSPPPPMSVGVVPGSVLRYKCRALAHKENRLQGRASGREQQHDVHSDGPWFTQGIVSGDVMNVSRWPSSAGSALQLRPPTSQDHSPLSPSLSVCGTLGSVVYVWRALVHAGDRAACADEQGPHQAAESSEAPEMEAEKRGFHKPIRHAKTTARAAEGVGGGGSVGGADCKAVPADESAA